MSVDREDHREVGDVAAGDERLLPVDHPLVTVSHGGGADVARVRAGAGLGDREAAAPSALDRGPEVGVLLLVVGLEEDVVRVTAELERYEGPAQLNLEQRVHHRAQTHPAVPLRGLDPEEARLPCLVLQRLDLVESDASFPVAFAFEHLRLERHELLGDERPHPVPDLAFLVGERQVHASTLVLPPA